MHTALSLIPKRKTATTNSKSNICSTVQIFIRHFFLYNIIIINYMIIHANRNLFEIFRASVEYDYFIELNILTFKLK